MKKSILLILITMLMLTACGKKLEETPVQEPTEEDQLQESESVEEFVCYNVVVSDVSLWLKATDDVAPAIVTSDADLYNCCEYPIVMWYGNTEIFIVDNPSPPASNFITVNTLTIATRDNTFDLSLIKDLLIEDNTGAVMIDVEPVVLEAAAEDSFWEELFPGYNSSDVFSFARGELSSGEKFIVQQKEVAEGIIYVCLGLDGYTCDISMSSQMIIQETGEVVDIEFIANPNYTPASM